MEVFTIGFTKKTAEDFFGTLRQAGIKQLIDVRLNNSSQLAGFAKREDLRFFLRELCRAAYVEEPLLTPSPDLLANYRKHRIPWKAYEERFLRLMEERNVEYHLHPEIFSTPSVLLCSEATADRCHRRLVLEYLKEKWGGIEIVHL